jgi:hypothetical protein
MTTCEKHGCPLTPLFTSTFCARCDEEVAVNAEDGKDMRCNQPHRSQDVGWYYNYPTCGTDANGSDVGDMDVCMGLRVKLEAIRLWQQSGLLEIGFAERCKRYVAGQMSDAEMAELEDDARSINAVAYGTAASNFARTASSELATDLRKARKAWREAHSNVLITIVPSPPRLLTDGERAVLIEYIRTRYGIADPTRNPD